jgi:hypothetical protein
MPDKARRLARLRARIVRELYLNEWRDVWFFPAFEGVQGWQGTQDILFVGLNPSLGHFPDSPCRRFYTHLKRQGFAKAHLTDVIKERAAGRTVDTITQDAERIRRHRRYLLAEIAILRPRLIVAMGSRPTRCSARCWGRGRDQTRGFGRCRTMRVHAAVPTTPDASCLEPPRGARSGL